MIQIKMNMKPLEALRNRTKLAQYVFNGLNRAWRDAIRAFIIATVNEIHVDTGMSMASLYALGVKVKFGSLVMGSAAGEGAKLYYTDIQGVKHETIMKSKTLGRELGKKAYVVKFAQRGSLSMHFRFKIVVFQWLIHEDSIPDHNIQGPWEAITAGKTAFEAEFPTALRRYLKEADIKNFLQTGLIETSNPLY